MKNAAKTIDLMHASKKDFTYDRAENFWRSADRTLAAFYDRYTRNWIAMRVDAEDNQIGNAGIGYTFADAFGYLSANNFRREVL